MFARHAHHRDLQRCSREYPRGAALLNLANCSRDLPGQDSHGPGRELRSGRTVGADLDGDLLLPWPAAAAGDVTAGPDGNSTLARTPGAHAEGSNFRAKPTLASYRPPSRMAVVSSAGSGPGRPADAQRALIRAAPPRRAGPPRRSSPTPSASTRPPPPGSLPRPAEPGAGTPPAVTRPDQPSGRNASDEPDVSGPDMGSTIKLRHRGPGSGHDASCC
jgi:hypothetical protein